MKPFLSKLVIAGSLLAIVAVAFAAEENKTERKKRKKGNDPTAALRAKVESADLGPDLKEKALKIIDEHAPEIAEARAKAAAVLTDDQKKAQKAAQKAARDAGKRGKEAQAEINAALNLSAEQKTKLEEAQKAAADAQGKLNKALAEILNDEQKEKLGIKGGKRKKNA
jgi:hypothetical protein